MSLRKPISTILIAAVLGAPALFGLLSEAQDISQKQGVTINSPLRPVRAGVTETLVFEELLSHNRSRQAALREYASTRTYQVVDLKGKVHAKEVGRMQFLAPDKKTFAVTAEEGSGVIRRLALNPLISSEIEAAAGKEHRNSSISPENYSLELIGEQQVGPYNCFVARAIPKRKDKYLFEGKIWIDVDDYAVVRIEGHPAKKLSFWIESAEVVRQYQKIDAFWLPQRDETYVQVRLYGKKVLTIDHQDYVVKSAVAFTETAQVRH